MAGTFTQILLHIVFSTKHREPLITPDLQPRLYAYIGGIIREEGGSLYEIGGMPDHLHLLIRWRADEALSNLMRRVKRNSSLWIHENFSKLHNFAWQEGYGAFSVSASGVAKVREYIANQEAHHRRRDFKAEFIGLLKAHDVQFDPDLIWK